MYVYQTEQRAIKLLLDVWEDKGATNRLHIAHLADSESLPLIMDAKRRGLNVTVETCPQYLYFTEDEIPDRSTLHKCAVSRPFVSARLDLDSVSREECAICNCVLIVY